ncbi:High-affinity fructose transporter ght6 [Hyphodiscus hymeniophilus]|uniref:High-affinity fructose transporter ght6 n=1 Tax=Hyphodiscus hymeniophilus TaxID=353542 RepID=A0A9P6VQB1_9HELO|nr:High-affinity fructose transporter ght6 [Hyphodiscus hymeniophilus]
MKFSRSRNAEHSPASTAVPSQNASVDLRNENGTAEKGGIRDLSKVPGVTIRTVFMALLVAMGGFIFGYDTGQISGFLEMDVFLQRFGIRTEKNATNPSGFYFTNVRSGLIVALLSIGTLIGCLIAGPVANVYGRKRSIPPWCLVFCLGVVIQMAVGPGQWVGIVMGRFVAGLGVGALSVLVPLYMSETSPVSVRGAVVSCYQLFITLGIFVADCINFGTEKRLDTGSYRIPMGIGFLWAIVLGVGIFFLPESPRFDWNHGNEAKARTTMAKFYGVAEHHQLIDDETEEIEKVRLASAGDHPWYEAITGPRMFYRVALAMALQTLQQLTGANYFFYYGTTIFKGVGISNSYVTAMILGGVNFGATILGVYMARHFRRRESLYWSALWQFMCFMVFASVGQFIYKGTLNPDGTVIPDQHASAHTSGTVMIVFACLFIVGFATTWGPLVWACIGEMFPYKYRAVGMGLATSANWFWNFMLAFFTPFITGDIDFAYGYVFAGCNLAASAVVYFFLMESSGRTLEEVDAMYLLHVSPRKSAGFVFDEETRKTLGQDLNTDAMHLRKRGRGFAKAEEGGQGGMLHDEGKFPEDVHDISNTNHTTMGSGANGHL